MADHEVSVNVFYASLERASSYWGFVVWPGGSVRKTVQKGGLRYRGSGGMIDMTGMVWDDVLRITHWPERSCLIYGWRVERKRY